MAASLGFWSETKKMITTKKKKPESVATATKGKLDWAQPIDFGLLPLNGPKYKCRN